MPTKQFLSMGPIGRGIFRARAVVTFAGEFLGSTSKLVPVPSKSDPFRMVGKYQIAGEWMDCRPNPPAGGEVLGLIQVRNGEGRLPRALRSLSEACDAIIGLDDGSSDGTYEVLRSFPKVVLVIRRARTPTPWCHPENETRNLLLRAADVRRPAYCVSLDDDEEFENPGMVRDLLLKLGPPGVRFGVAFMWDSPDTVLTRPLGGGPRLVRARAFRWHPGSVVKSAKLHCGSVPYGNGYWDLPQVRILHWGTLRREDRVRKLEMYARMDPGGRIQGYPYFYLTGKGVFEKVPSRA